MRGVVYGEEPSSAPRGNEFEQSLVLRDPAALPEGSDDVNHLAHIYETEAERAAVIESFLRHGIERGERCLYIADAGTEDEVYEALRERGTDVDSAVSTGQLTVHTVQETYLRNGTFEPEAMFEFYTSVIDTELEGFAGVRIAAESTWLQDDATTMDAFMEYEAKVTELLEDFDSVALCQYDRNAFAPEVVQDIIRTHPHLIYDGTVSHNVYHIPPESFLGSDEPEREVDRMLNTLVERTTTKAALHEHNRSLRQQHRIVSDPDTGFVEKLEALFGLGCERFGLAFGALARIDPDGDRFELEHVSPQQNGFEVGLELPFSETCWPLVVENGTAGFADPAGTSYEESSFHREFGLEAFLGTHIEVDGADDRALFFASPDPRAEEFSDEEHTFQRLMGQWIEYELERQRHESRLTALTGLSRKLMDARTPTEVGEHVVEAGSRELGLPMVALAEYDAAAGELHADATTDVADTVVEATSLLSRESGEAWDAFVAGTFRRLTDPVDASTIEDAPAITELVLFPLGDHGVFVAGTTTSGGFTPRSLEFVEAVAASTEAGLDRVTRQQALEERERVLENQNETLARLDGLNDIIRSIDQGLVGASTRSEIAAVVCEQLATAGPYALATMSEYDPGTGTLTMREAAGDDGTDCERLPATDKDCDVRFTPARHALETRRAQVVNNLLEDRASERWRQVALNRGYHALISLPLEYEDALYGVVTVYADQPDAFDELECSVLSELADNIAYAINAVERTKRLVSQDITILEYRMETGDIGAIAATREYDCCLTLETIVPRSDGGYRVFLSVRGDRPSTIDSFLANVPGSFGEPIAEQTVDGGVVHRYETDLVRDGLLESIMVHGGTPRTLTVAGGTASVAVALPADGELREFDQAFKDRYPDAELVARRSNQGTGNTAAEIHADLTDRLTARQLEVLQTAYFSGYFDQPRNYNSAELAGLLDITAPTVTTHLRTAQRKLCDLLFADGTDES